MLDPSINAMEIYKGKYNMINSHCVVIVIAIGLKDVYCTAV